MKSLAVLLFVITSLIGFSQEVNNKVIDEKTGKEIILGLCNKEGLMQAPFSEWFNREYNSYIPDERVMVQLKQFTGKWKAVVVLGTWCSDSQLQISRFLKIVENAGGIPAGLKMICLDSEKKCNDVDVIGMKIEKVPTFIIYVGDKELGRIIETPLVNMETDLLNILLKH